MKLVSPHVTKYRSAVDSGPFTVERDMSCLVGNNESGNTNVSEGAPRRG